MIMKNKTDRTERVELTVSCMLCDGSRILLQNRIKEDWKGYTLPGGHVEPGEAFVDAVIREMKEETGLTVIAPVLCGIKQFPIANGRYVVLLFKADEYTGTLVSSDEGKMEWIDRCDLSKVNLVEDFMEQLQVMDNDALTEFQYVKNDREWEIRIK